MILQSVKDSDKKVSEDNICVCVSRSSTEHGPALVVLASQREMSITVNCSNGALCMVGQLGILYGSRLLEMLMQLSL